ncbi:unnamed protein product [Ectocarpus sp. 12 AP-2014]
MYVGSDTVPWYIKEVQDKGLDTQGEFSRWWQSNLDPKANAASVKGMKVAELKAQLARMDLPTTGLKADLAERLSAAYLRCSLSDDNFQHAQVTDVSANDEDLPNCFPEVYEKATEAELEKLWRQSRQKNRKK